MTTPLSATVANLRRLRDEAAADLPADPIDPVYTEVFGDDTPEAVINYCSAAVNALPSLLDVVEERDRLREAIETYRAACPPQWFRLTPSEHRLFAALTEVGPHA